MKRLLALFLVLFWSVTLVGEAAAGNRVWCVGADGHVGFESALGAKCAPNPYAASASKTEISALTASGHCGSCTDISIASDSTAVSVFALGVPTPHEKPIPAPDFAVLLPAILIDQPAPRLAERMERAGPSLRLLEHRSVVLLI